MGWAQKLVNLRALGSGVGAREQSEMKLNLQESVGFSSF
jgi:hypothetical protein